MGTIIIDGGTINVTGASGIGSRYIYIANKPVVDIGKITINGGQFNLNKGVYPQPKNSSNEEVYPLTVQLNDS